VKGVVPVLRALQQEKEVPQAPLEPQQAKLVPQAHEDRLTVSQVPLALQVILA
jgi:hypothetical protein